MTDKQISTLHHDLDLPAVGYDASDPSWAALVNNAIGDLDANVKLSGAVADRPATDNTPDHAWFEATDQGIVYRNDPSAGWVAIAGVGSASDPIPEQHVETQVAGSVETEQLRGGVTNNKTVSRLFGERIATNTPSGASETAFTSGITSDYPQYAISFSLVPVNNNVAPTLQVSTDGGSTWENGASAYKWVFRNERSNNSGGRSNGDGDTSISLSDGVRPGAGEFTRGTVWVTEPADTSLKTLIEARTTNWDDSGNIETAYVGGGYDSAATVDGVRLQFNEGGSNIDSGTVSLLGVMV